MKTPLSKDFGQIFLHSFTLLYTPESLGLRHLPLLQLTVLAIISVSILVPTCIRVCRVSSNLINTYKVFGELTMFLTELSLVTFSFLTL